MRKSSMADTLYVKRYDLLSLGMLRIDVDRVLWRV